MLSKMSDTVLRFVDPDNERARQQLINIRQKMGVTSIFRIWFILIVDVVWRLLIMFKHLNVQFPPLGRTKRGVSPTQLIDIRQKWG